jgi:arylsulfatase A-like enzyme
MQNILLFPACFLFLIISACGTKDASKNSDTDRPNIIFMMTDDHAYQAISAYDDKLIHTPAIDQLASQGMRFDQAFVTNSICSPCRAVILTGKFSHINGVRNNAVKFDSTQVTFPKLLQGAGYQTAVIGKWHLKTQPTGFDFWKVLPDQGDYYHPEFRTKDGMVKEEGYATDVVTNMAIEWLDKGRDPSKPFMLMYQHKAPHREWWPSMDHLNSFKDSPLPEPKSLYDNYENRGRAAKEAEMRLFEHMALSSDNKIRPDIVEKHGYTEFMKWYKPVYLKQYDRLSEDEKKRWDAVYGPINEDFDKNPRKGKELIAWKYQRYMQDYLACIQSIDDNVGRLMKYLDENGLSKNTIVVYTSDQGFYLGEHGWFDKRFMYEESFRTPLIIRWPEHIKAGSINNDLVQNLDFAQTFLDIAGLNAPGDMQGKSLKPLLKGNNDKWRDAIYYHYYEYPGIHAVKRHYGVRTDRYKLIHFYFDVDEWELYDLETDPQEMNNLYGNSAYTGIQEDLHKRLEELRLQYGDSDALNLKYIKIDTTRN